MLKVLHYEPKVEQCVKGKMNVAGVALGTKHETVRQGKMTVAGIQPQQGHQRNQKQNTSTHGK